MNPLFIITLPSLIGGGILFGLVLYYAEGLLYNPVPFMLIGDSFVSRFLAIGAHYFLCVFIFFCMYYPFVRFIVKLFRIPLDEPEK
jgi:uncharacterized membrane protein